MASVTCTRSIQTNMEILEHDDDNNKEDLVVEDVVVKVASQVDRAKHDLS